MAAAAAVVAEQLSLLSSAVSLSWQPCSLSRSPVTRERYTLANSWRWSVIIILWYLVGRKFGRKKVEIGTTANGPRRFLDVQHGCSVMSGGHSRRSISVRVLGWPTSRSRSVADVVEHVQYSAMASRITSGARLCVRASIDRLVCNLSRSRHHNAVESAAVRRGSDRMLQCYQVSTSTGLIVIRAGSVRSFPKLKSNAVINFSQPRSFQWLFTRRSFFLAMWQYYVLKERMPIYLYMYSNIYAAWQPFLLLAWVGFWTHN